ncbi:hypothetical protein [Methanoregula formicica]|uniref:Uncharacterized protein n=1 Tax=Methanoregula formicica (strain DSM 22288 / NBRC 105244 / SMSP) TaxID=593750 RepID=L0HJD5_METFS|nr:hypothetical protein [Methanoregula formicica]AGB03428.1 hypothetical protein Metfor_2428 [Methanoregula formicica SMSP]
MSYIEVEELSREPETLIRSCKIKVNGKSFTTPSRSVSVTKSTKTELDVAKPLITQNNTPLGEVYTRISLDDLSRIADDSKQGHERGEEFSKSISLRLEQLRDLGTIPYLVISVVDSNGNPYNQLPEKKILDLIFNLLWGTQNNAIIVPPLMGIFPEEKQYLDLINALHERQESSNGRKPLPIMPIIPSAYALVAPTLLKQYWDIGCRLFAFNCENKKYGAFGFVIEKAHTELDKFSKESKESYAIHALNSKLKTGKGDTSRINSILGSGFGFDSFSSNHIIPKFIPPSTDIKDFFVFNDGDYGFSSFSKVVDPDKVLNTNIFKKYDLGEFDNLSSSVKLKVCNSHNIEKSIREIQSYPKFIESEKLVTYLSNKEKIKGEILEIKNIAGHIKNPEMANEKASKKKKWFKK